MTSPAEHIIVVGAGASGLMASLAAARGGNRVTLLEKMPQPGLKLRITGKGRCNLTNTAPLRDFLNHVGPEPRFMRNSFSLFFNKELMSLLESLGVPLVEERGGRVYPKSGKALDIFLALITELEHSPNVEICKNARVASLIIDKESDGTPYAAGVRLADGTSVRGDRVVVATGGMSYPLTGSTGDGYRFAQDAGHSVHPCLPALVALKSDLDIPQELQNFSLKNVQLSLTMPDGKKLCSFFGELWFTADGIDGPIVLSSSRVATQPLHNGTKLTAHIDFKPAIDANELDKRLINDLNSNGNRLFHDALRIWLPAEVVPLALKQLHIEYYKRLNQIGAAERKRLLHFLKDFSFPITDTGNFENAIITQGGVNLKEIDPKNMESRIVKRLHFTGETLNLDADTGGYNLQIAFTTGFAATAQRPSRPDDKA